MRAPTDMAIWTFTMMAVAVPWFDQPCLAEVRIIESTADHELVGSETLAEGKRLALQEAKRLALEQVGTYVEAIREIRNTEITREEIRAYTAGIIEVIEHEALELREGGRTKIRVKVSVKLDTEVVARQIEVVRRNEQAKRELMALRQEREGLKKDLESKSQEIGKLQDQVRVERLRKDRDQTLTRLETDELLAHAWVALAGEQQGATVTLGVTQTKAQPLVTTVSGIVLSRDPGNAKAHNMLGVLLSLQGRHEPALSHFREASRLAPEVPDYRANVGNALRESGRADEAARIYEEVIREAPTYAPAYYNLGNVFHNKGDRARAVTYFRKAVAQNPNYAEAHYNLGVTLHEEGNALEAITAFKAALRVNPDYAEAHYNLGAVLYQQGDVEGAELHIRQATRLKPDYAEAHYNLAELLRSEGRNDEAATSFRAYLRVAPKTPAEEPYLAAAQDALAQMKR